MRKNTSRLFFLCITLLLLFCTEQSQTHAAEEKRQVSRSQIVVALGDSLTSGFTLGTAAAYPALLEKKLQSAGHRYRVINAGVNAETSSGALARVKWMLELQPDIAVVILETGVNDSFRMLRPSFIKNTITKIVEDLQRSGVTILLAGMQPVTNVGEKYGIEFRKIYKEIAAEQNIILIPSMLDGVAGNPRLNLKDGLHPTEEGHRIIANTIYPYLIKALEEKQSAKLMRFYQADFQQTEQRSLFHLDIFPSHIL